MPKPYRSAPLASDDWMRAQQMRAELEAQEWRLLRAELARPLPQTRPAPRGGSIILKGLVRFLIGAFGGYLGWIAALDSGGGEIDGWFAVIAGFVIALALTAFGAGRDFVHAVSETARWVILLALGVGATYLLVLQIAAAG